MIPTKQTILHDPENGKIGNCFSAVLASLLHLPIEDVPIFYEEDWQKKLNQWLEQYNLAFMQIGYLEGYCKEAGITGLYHELAGHTNRSADVLHATVGIDGVIHFDPHPDNSGLKEVTCSGVFVCLKPWLMNQK